MIRELLLIHHSHTDIGYTHPQPVVLEMHRRFMDQAIECCEADADFRWTCETTGITLDWWQSASRRSRERFLTAIHRGQIEVAAMQWNLTPLIDHRLLLRSLEPVAFFRSLGIPIRSAMNSDVNGVPWGLVDALLDHGIDGFSMGVNEHYGYAVQPRPGAFEWQSPTGRRITVWNGLQYWNAANIQLRMPSSVDEVAAALGFLRIWEDRGYPLSFLPLQITTASAPDNAAPDLRIPEFVREWNASGQSIAIRLVNLTDVFDRLRQETLPKVAGDWTDWWNFGCGSTARETAIALDGMRLLESAASLSPTDRLQESAASNLTLYAEHTWGADRSVYEPGSVETYTQLNQKLGYAYRGYTLARMANRDGLAKLADQIGGEAPSLLVFNPASVAVFRTIKAPVGAEYLADPRTHLAHRQDVASADLDDPESYQWVGPIELPAYGYRTIPLDQLPKPSPTVVVDHAIGNERLRATFDDQPGLVSLTLDGDEYAGRSAWRFGSPILETPTDGRGGIFGPLDWRQIHVHEQWHRDWRAERQPGRLLAQETRQRDGVQEHEQRIAMPNGDTIRLLFRVFPGEPNLEIELTLDKVATAAPNALYLPMPIDADASAVCHYETAGAIVELDREQLPFASRHYLTTMRFIRLQDEAKGITVACPHAPLWQVGGFTFGRFDGDSVERREAMLNAWLTNNYWDVNFCADQSGRMRFRFRVIPHRAQPIGQSIAAALAYASQPSIHLTQGLGESRRTAGRLIEANGDAIVVGMSRDTDGLVLDLLNPSDAPATTTIAAGDLWFGSAFEADLSGRLGVALQGGPGRCVVSLHPRQWKRVRLV